MACPGDTERPEIQQELAFLDERLQLVDRQLASLCADFIWRHPELEEAIQEARRRSYGEEPIAGLPQGMSSRIGQLKREEQLLRWLRGVVQDIPLPILLWKGPFWTLEMAEAIRSDSPTPTYSEEWWELRSLAEALRRLGRDWQAWSRGGAADEAIIPGAPQETAQATATTPPAAEAPGGARSARRLFEIQARGLTRRGQPSWASSGHRGPVRRRMVGESLLAQLWRWIGWKLGLTRDPQAAERGVTPKRDGTISSAQ